MNNTDDFKEQTDSLKKLFPEEPLPESLSPQNIENLVSGKKQKSSKRGVIKKFVACAVAACVAICGIFVLDAGVYAPGITVVEGKPAAAKSYNNLLSIMKDYRKKQTFENGINSIGSVFAPIGSGTAKNEIAVYNMNMDEASTEAASTSDASSSYSKTNTRVDGIDESDIVKTDGRFIYAVHDDKVYILRIGENGTLENCSTVEPLKAYKSEKAQTDDDDIELYYDDSYSGCYAYLTSYVSGIYINGSTLIVEFVCTAEETIRTGIAVYDLTDPSSPVEKNVFLQDGSLVSTRAIGNTIVLVTMEYTEGYDLNEDIIPTVGTSENGEAVADEKIPSDDIFIANADTPENFLVVSKISIADGTVSKSESISVLGGGDTVYCTDETLYVATSRYVDDDSLRYCHVETDITAFDITADKPVYRASCSVLGSMLNTFSIDEYNGFVRVAATTDDDNRIYVMDKNLQLKSMLRNIAPNEQIKAVRFSGDTGYVVTFYQTDPLFVIDLSDPENPEIKGELKIPGFSSYLHPVGENLLLGVGTGGDDNGADNSAKLSLFDVSDPENPKEIDTLIIDDAYFNTEYKAFVSDSDSSAFMIPYDRYEYKTTGTEGVYGSSENYTGVLRIAVENGKIIEKNRYEIQTEDYYFSRVAFAENTVYAVSTYYGALTVVSFAKQTGEKLQTNKF